MKVNVYCVHLLFMGVFILKSKMKGFLRLITVKQGDKKEQLKKFSSSVWPLGQPYLLGSYAFFGKEYYIISIISCESMANWHMKPIIVLWHNPFYVTFVS